MQGDFCTPKNGRFQQDRMAPCEQVLSDNRDRQEVPDLETGWPAAF
jgi:hypothetical protein